MAMEENDPSKSARLGTAVGLPKRDSVGSTIARNMNGSGTYVGKLDRSGSMSDMEDITSTRALTPRISEMKATTSDMRTSATVMRDTTSDVKTKISERRASTANMTASTSNQRPSRSVMGASISNMKPTTSNQRQIRCNTPCRITTISPNGDAVLDNTILDERSEHLLRVNYEEYNVPHEDILVSAAVSTVIEYRVPAESYCQQCVVNDSMSDAKLSKNSSIICKLQHCYGVSLRNITEKDPKMFWIDFIIFLGISTVLIYGEKCVLFSQLLTF